VKQSIEDVAAAYARATTARRAYIVGGDVSQLGEVASLDWKLAQASSELDALVRDEPTQRARLAQLVPLMRERGAALDAEIAAKRAGRAGIETADDLSLGSRVRVVREQMVEEENARLAEREARARRYIAWTKGTEIVGTLVSFAILLGAFWQMRKARLVAEAGSAAKTEFLSSMSHELRTPLHALLGFAQLLQRDRKSPLLPRHAERVDQILKAGDHLQNLIDDVLEMSRIEARRVAIVFEPVSVADLVEEVRQTLQPMATRQGIRLEVAHGPPGVPRVCADRTRLRQILINFGSNAIKYNRPAGDVTFSFAVAEDPGAVRVSVEDGGFGIPLEKQAGIFQPFERAGQENGSIEGTGIGLAIALRLAQLMKGRVGFHSVPGEGSDFWVEVPVYGARHSQHHPPSSDARSPASVS
jgi:signal transduction histidine kinase